MTLDKLKPGMVVYDASRIKMGNTTRTSMAVWLVRIISADPETQTVQASWNSNPVRTYYRHQWSKWRMKKPMLVKSGFGYRLATREEITAGRGEHDA